MRLIFAAGLAALALGVSACGGYSTSPATNPSNPRDPNVSGPTGPTSSLPARNLTIDIAEINGPYSFYPSPARMGFEQMVVWRNDDTVTHHVVFDDMSIDTGTLAPGTLSQPFAVRPGTWTYHCAIHPTMVGSMTVGMGAGQE